jgi:hypothetical protein
MVHYLVFRHLVGAHGSDDTQDNILVEGGEIIIRLAAWIRADQIKVIDVQRALIPDQ